MQKYIQQQILAICKFIYFAKEEKNSMSLEKSNQQSTRSSKAF